MFYFKKRNYSVIGKNEKDLEFSFNNVINVYSFGISDGWSPLSQTKFVPNEIATIISYFMRIVALIMIVCYIARTVKNIKNKDIAKKDKIKNITNELIIILIIICVILYFAPVVGRIGGKEEPNTMPSFVVPH